MRTATKSYTSLAICFAFGLLSPLVVDALGRGKLATIMAMTGWLCFFIIAAAYPIVSIRAGFIRTRTSVTYRVQEPLRFWVGLCALEGLLVFFVFLATLALHAYQSSSI